MDTKEELIRTYQQWPNILDQINTLIIKLKRREINGSFSAAKHTTELLRNIIGSTKWTSAKQILHRLQIVGRELVTAQSLELAVGNMVRRILYIIREEYMAALNTKMTKKQTSSEEPLSSTGGQSMPSLQTILAPGKHTEFDIVIKELKQSVMEVIAELMEEFSCLHESISSQALEHIHANEVILTLGHSMTVRNFLATAAKKRDFKVIVVEGAPNFDGQKMARELSLAGIDTTLILDNAVFAMMARVNKVVVASSKVVANGGLIAQSGMHNIALAAKEFSVPFVCTVGLYKLSPLFPYDVDALNELVSPGVLLEYADSHLENVLALNPSFDYVPPNLVDLFITNIGGHQPSYIYRLLAEYYSPEDYNL